MTLVHPESARHAATPEVPDPAELTRCEQCGAEMATEQEWCTECGAARTLIHPAPDLRLAAGAALLVVLAALVAVVIALASLSDSADTQTAAELGRTVIVTVTSPSPAAAPSGTGNAGTGSTGTAAGSATSTTASGATSFDGFPGWPIGLSGWTVVLASTPTEEAARQLAVQFQSRSLAVGILDSDQHPQMTPGHWIVFLHRYPTYEAAHEGSLSLHARGFDTARPARVESSGG